MDLQISVFLLFILFTAGHSLSCYECSDTSGSCAGQTVKTCPSGSTQCMSITAVEQAGDTRVTTKDCAINCQNGSLNFGIVKTTSSCCNTDKCNAQDAPDSSNIPNGKKCYYCDQDKSCSNTLSCSGTEDRCIEATGTFEGQSWVFKGCVSKSICGTTSSVRGIESVSCCEGNLCNGAQSVTQSFLFLCCSLLSYFMMH